MTAGMARHIVRAVWAVTGGAESAMIAVTRLISELRLHGISQGKSTSCLMG